MKTSLLDTLQEVIHSCVYFIMIILKSLFVLYGRLGRIKVLRKNGLAIVVTNSQPF